MNIVVAFTLEAFLLEYESQRTELETRVDRRLRELGLVAAKQGETPAAVIFDREEAYVENGVQFKLGDLLFMTPLFLTFSVFSPRNDWH